MRTDTRHPLGDLGFEPASRTLHDLGFEPMPGTRQSFARKTEARENTARRDRASLGTKAVAAATATLKEPALRPEIEDATNQPQPVGAVEGDSGRVITQPSDNPAINQALATNAMPPYRAELETAIGKIPGASLTASRNAKNPRRLAEKIEFEGQPAETVNDYGAAQISVDSPQAKNAVVAAVRKTFPVVRVQDHFAEGDPKYGYRSDSMQLRMPSGISQELQIVPKEVFQANRREHKRYKAARNATLAGKNASVLQNEAKQENNAAMAQFMLRNQGPGSARSSKHGAARNLVKGARVMLPDGSNATIAYLDPNINLARVRTADGRKLTLRQDQLRAAHAP